MNLEAAASFILIMLVHRTGFVVQLICYVHPLLLMFTCSRHPLLLMFTNNRPPSRYQFTSAICCYSSSIYCCTYRKSVTSLFTSLVYKTYNLNMVVLTISYQVGFGPCAVQVLQLFQPLYLLIMILQNTSHQVHYICRYFIMRTLLLYKCFTRAMGRDTRRLISTATSILQITSMTNCQQLHQCNYTRWTGSSYFVCHLGIVPSLLWCPRSDLRSPECSDYCLSHN